MRDEVGFILYIRQNAIQVKRPQNDFLSCVKFQCLTPCFFSKVLIPKYGLEGTLYLRPPGSTPADRVNFEFDDTVPSQRSGDVVLKLFQKVVVQMTLDSTNIQHEKLVIRLVDPQIPGFSVARAPNIPLESNNAKKRLSSDQTEDCRKKQLKTAWYGSLNSTLMLTQRPILIKCSFRKKYT